MARIRTIKPQFFKNEELAELTMTCRLLFIGLWTLADKEGRLEDRPKRIKVEVFPYDSINVDVELSKLQEAGFINRYQVGDLRVINIPTFSKHQRVTGSEATTESELPDYQCSYEEGNIEEGLGNIEETLRKQQGNTQDDRKGKDIRKGDIGKDIVKPFENISLTWDEDQKLFTEIGDLKDDCYKYLSEYKIEKKYKTQSDYLTIKRWVIDAVTKKKANGPNNTDPKRKSKHEAGLVGVKNDLAELLKSIGETDT